MHVDIVGVAAAEVLVEVLAPARRFVGVVAGVVVFVVVLVVHVVDEALTARLLRFKTVCPEVTVTVIVVAGGVGNVVMHGGAVRVVVVVTGVPVLVTTDVESVIGTKVEQNDDAFSAIRIILQSLTRFRCSNCAAGAI